MIKSYPPKSAFSRGLAQVRAILFFGMLSFALFFFGLWLSPAALMLKRASFIKWMCRTYLGAVLPLFGIRFRLEGAGNLPAGKTIFVANHQSWIDITAFMLHVRFPSFLAKKEIESWPYFGGAMKILKCVFVDRSDRRSRHEVGKQVKDNMAAGVDFCIYPEGTRSADGRLNDFAGGAFRIAVDAEAVLTPVVIDESWWILNKKGFFLYPGTVRLRVLPPIDTRASENKDYKELTQRVRGQIDAALAEMRSQPEASGFVR